MPCPMASLASSGISPLSFEVMLSKRPWQRICAAMHSYDRNLLSSLNRGSASSLAPIRISKWQSPWFLTSCTIR